MDRSPKKPCKHCGQTGHFSYQCFANPKKIIRRTPIKKLGKHGKQWLVTRATWIRRNPPPINGTYWICYLQIHPWCPVQIDIEHLTLDHVISRTTDPSQRFKLSNLRPACMPCNQMKGSKKLDSVKPAIV